MPKQNFLEHGSKPTLRMHWRLSTILKQEREVYKVMLLDMEKYIYSESSLR